MACGLEVMGRVSWRFRRKDRIMKGGSSRGGVRVWRAHTDVCTACWRKHESSCGRRGNM